MTCTLLLLNLPHSYCAQSLPLVTETLAYSLPSLHRGQDSFGQCGDGYSTDLTSPTLVPLGLNFTQVATANVNACGVTVDYIAYCWGCAPLCTGRVCGVLAACTQREHPSLPLPLILHCYALDCHL